MQHIIDGNVSSPPTLGGDIGLLGAFISGSARYNTGVMSALVYNSPPVSLPCMTLPCGRSQSTWREPPQSTGRTCKPLTGSPGWRPNPQPSCCALTVRTTAASSGFILEKETHPRPTFGDTSLRGNSEEVRTRMDHVASLLKGQSTVQHFPLLVFFESMTLSGSCPPLLPLLVPFSFPHRWFTALHEFPPSVIQLRSRRNVSCHPSSRQT